MPKANTATVHQSNGHSHAGHQAHANVRNRLKRAGGHLDKIVCMLDEGRDCPDIAQQLQAVIRALEAAKRTLIYDHIDNCLEDAVGSATRAQRQTIEEFKTISKYL